MAVDDPLAIPDDVGLDAVLRTLGVPEDEIVAAAAVNRLELLAMEHVVLPPGPRYDEAEVAEQVGVPVEVSRGFWRALGFPQPDPNDKVFSDDDVTMMREVVAVLEADDLSTELSIEMTRVIGSAMSRIALAQVDVLEAELRKRVPGIEVEDAPSAMRTAQFLPLMPRVFEYVWRRHLAAGARARLSLAQADVGEDEVVVGFADLVGYTALSQQLSEEELAGVVQRFEAIAYDTVSALGGRVVKLIGDGVMFSADDSDAAASIAVELAERYRDDEELSDVRVGLAIGPVLRRDGDLYGPTVNRASRIVNVAYPGSVLVEEAMFDLLIGDDTYLLKKVRSHNLKDIGRTRLWSLKRIEPIEEDDDEDGDHHEDGDHLEDDVAVGKRAKKDKSAKRAAKDASGAAALGEGSPPAGEPEDEAIGEGEGEDERDRTSAEKREARRALMADRRERRRRSKRGERDDGDEARPEEE